MSPARLVNNLRCLNFTLEEYNVKLLFFRARCKVVYVRFYIRDFYGIVYKGADGLSEAKQLPRPKDNRNSQVDSSQVHHELLPRL